MVTVLDTAEENRLRKKIDEQLAPEKAKEAPAVEDFNDDIPF